MHHRVPTLAMCCYGLLFLLPIFALLAGWISHLQMGLVLPTPDTFLTGVVTGVVSVALAYYPMHIIVVRRNLEIPAAQRASQRFASILPFMLTGAAIEELFSRGLLMPLFLPLGTIPAITYSALFHWLSHFGNPNLRMFEYTSDKSVAASGWFVVSVWIATLFVSTGSLVPGLVAHLTAAAGFGWLTVFKLTAFSSPVEQDTGKVRAEGRIK
ncbi:MAG: CPBP family intramembrane glutamic endopeptidase [Candidatus Thorarchaeota archaeon]